MAKKFDIQYYFSEGFHSIFTHGFMSFAAVCMIVACLLIMGSFTLVAVNLDNMLGDLEAENEFLAYVDESYTEEQARDIKSQIEAIPNVSQVTFVTRAEAMDDFRAGRENNELLADLPDEVLRDRFRIHVQDIKQLKATSEQVQKITGVADVNAAYDIAQGFVLVRNIATGVAAVLVAMLAVVSLFIIANTIKLAFFYRREEIAIMKMCGATNSFIRWPFIVEGIVACLLIMGSFTLVAVNLDNMLGDLEAENEFLAYVDESYTEEQARDIKSQIEAIPNVSQVTFVTRAEAMDDFRAGRENNELLADLPDEVLRDRFRIHVQDIKQLKATSEQVQKITGVADVNAAYDIAQGFVLVRNIATGVAAVLVAMLAVVSLFIIANTIKLAFFYRREEIAIMKMCGATNSFIRWPFIVEGMLLGLTGALVAFLLQWAVYELVGRAVIQSNGLSLLTILPFQSMIVHILPVFIGAGLFIGVVGSVLAIRKFLQV